MATANVIGEKIDSGVRLTVSTDDVLAIMDGGLNENEIDQTARVESTLTNAVPQSGAHGMLCSRSVVQ